MCRLGSPSLLLGLALLLGSCKNTEDYLEDIRTAQSKEGRLNLAIYDAGLLIHEGLTGIMDQDVLTLSQMGRAVHDCGLTLEKNEVALCRADAVSLLVHIALRYPLPPIVEPFLPDKAVGDIAWDQVQALENETRLLQVETMIPLLSNPDRVVAEKGHHELQQLTGEKLPRDPKPWEAWWATHRERVLTEVTAKGTEPLRILAGLRYNGLGASRAVLGFLSLRLQLIDPEGLREMTRRAIVRLARHVVVFGIRTALQDKDPAVRTAAARGAREVLDPSFGDALQMQLLKEIDADTKSRILSALRYYPGKTTLHALLAALKDSDRAVRMHGRRVLTELVGDDFGADPGPWLLWYEREGKTLWP